jgi:hypothetical protein
VRIKTFRNWLVPAAFLLLAGCAQTPVAPPGPPPPQNLLGSTGELQLVTELSIGLAKDYGSDKVLVVLEIDDTLLTADSGSACNSAGTSSVELTQPDAAAQVQRLQQAGMRVMVLTSRGPDCSQQTLDDLRNNNFNFAASSLPPQNGYAESWVPDGGNRPVLYTDGVFFTAGQNKGIMLNALLEKSGQPYPMLIVIVDSNQKDLNAYMGKFSHTNTKVHTWRYERDNKAVVEVALNP